MFYSSTGLPALAHTDVNYDVVLGNCNRKLTQWMDNWENQMKRGIYWISLHFQVTDVSLVAHGEPFHYSFLSLFCLYVRLFLNSFGIQAAMQPV